MCDESRTDDLTTVLRELDAAKALLRQMQAAVTFIGEQEVDAAPWQRQLASGEPGREHPRELDEHGDTGCTVRTRHGGRRHM